MGWDASWAIEGRETHSETFAGALGKEVSTGFVKAVLMGTGSELVQPSCSFLGRSGLRMWPAWRKAELRHGETVPMPELRTLNWPNTK